MTQDQIDRIKAIPLETAELQRQISVANAELKKLQKECDHTYPDGTTAKVPPLSGPHDWQCKICRFVRT